MKKIVCLGLVTADILIEPVPDEYLMKQDTIQVKNIQLCSGGDANNQAIALAKMKKPVAIWGRVGADSFGIEAKNLLESSHVDTEHFVIDSSVETSVTAILVTNDANRVFLHKPAGNNAFSLDLFPLSSLDDAAILAIGSLRALPGLPNEQLIKLLQYAKSRSIITAADTTADIFHLGSAAILQLLPWLDYFLPSEAEAVELTGKTDLAQAAEIFLSHGAGTVVIKLGSRGCYVKNRMEEFWVPALSVQAIDTTGAGDNFVAGFLAKLHEGASLKECACAAVTAGSLSTTCIGASTASYTMGDIEDGIRILTSNE